MSFSLFIIAVFASIFIIYQDIKSRRINLVLTLAFIGLIITRYYLISDIEQCLFNACFSLLYFLLCYMVIRIYYFMKGSSEPIIDSKIGWGDIILLFAVGCTIEPEKMVLFFTVTFILSILLHILFSRNSRAIPLAAYLLLTYNVYLVFVIL